MTFNIPEAKQLTYKSMEGNYHQSPNTAVVLPLIYSRLFFFNLHIMYFLEKSTKNLGTREKSCYTSIGCTRNKTLKQALRFARLHNTSQAPFAHAAYSEPSVGHLLVISGFRLFSGRCGTCFARLYKESYTRANLQTASHNGLKTSGLTLDFSTVPFRRRRRITFAMEFAMPLSRIKVIPKEIRHR